jgi:hypothetical protein
MTRGRIAALLGTTAALVVVMALPVDAAPFRRPGGPARPGVNFVSACRYSHSAGDDPIVHPGHPGGSHQHDFFANTTTDAHSTYESLLAGDTTCRREGDTAAYWVPSLLEGGQTVRPSHVLAYYLPAGKDLASIKPFPDALKVVTDASLPNTRWACVGDGTVGAGTREVPTCPAGQHLVLRIHFPDCWDGANVDSADHRSHMTYSRRGRCPSTHPVAVPRLRLGVHYPASNGGSDVALSSGGPETAHADFFNAWDPAELARLVRECLNAGQHCGQRGPA